ncbi:hypothetical protein GAB14E_2090 [Colwellia psychrerythraea]|uniref:Uncharacterized protein n=2 Tax=Colwellia psychrerythraea TaxID=28229 RepID=A0A099KW97_COLPS|nr:hypothetical protein GAB14E_2090 [Colwellia psychrerythraea]
MLIFSPASASSATEHVTDLTPENIKMMYIHTNQHSIVGVQNIAVIEVENASVLLPLNTATCSNGLWIDASKDAATYSMLLTAITAKKNINILYTENPSPWNIVSYCEIIRVGIK